MNRLFAAIAQCLGASLIALGMGLSTAHAQEHHHAASGSASDSASDAAPSSDEWIPAEVRRIDTAQNRLTLKHGDIRHLDMPGMTMPFRLKPGLLSAEQLAALQPGTLVEVRIQQLQGQLVITELRVTSGR